MRRLLMVLLMLTLAGAAMASVTGNVSPNIKAPGTIYINPPERVTGDTFGNPFFLPSFVPGGCVTVTGVTSGFTNDYDEACPYTGSTSPDVVYSYTHTDASINTMNVDMCYSSYDTKVYVYDSLDTNTPIACNDDYYFAAPCYTYSSFVGPVCVLVGHTYYIVIDGYGGSAGAYSMTVCDAMATCPVVGACCYPSGDCAILIPADCTGIWQGENTGCEPNPCPPPPPVICPPGALIEGEPPCNDSYVDNYNGGCNSTPNVWSYINPQAGDCAVMCGKSCTIADVSRDTDWFVSIGTGGPMTGTATAEFPLQYILIYGTDCAAPTYVLGTGDPGVPVTLVFTIADGDEVWNWIGNQGFSGWGPEKNYVLDVCGIKNPPPPPGACCRNGLCILTSEEMCLFFGGVFYGPGVPCSPTVCEPVATEHKSWGAVKNLYR